MANTIPSSSRSMGDNGGARIVGKGSETAAGPGPEVMAASTLDSDRVLSSDGEEVGKIKTSLTK